MIAKRVSELIENDLADVPCWIDCHVLPKRGTWLIGGPTKLGKSFILIEIARALATGTRPFGCPFLNTPFGPSKVLFVEQELGEYGLHKRLKTTMSRHQPSGFRDNFFYLSKEPDFKFDTPTGRDNILEALESCQPNVLILDPISFFHDGEEQDNTAIGQLFSFIEKIKKCYVSNDLSIIMSHHFRKPPSGAQDRKNYDPLALENLRGASKWTDAADTITTLAREGSSKQWWFCKTRWTTRHGEGLEDMMLKITPEDDQNQVTFERLLGDAPGLGGLKLKPVGSSAASGGKGG